MASDLEVRRFGAMNEGLSSTNKNVSMDIIGNRHQRTTGEYASDWKYYVF
jgi:hypothetical protein